MCFLGCLLSVRPLKFSGSYEERIAKRPFKKAKITESVARADPSLHEDE